MKILVYKRTHPGDPDESGVFGVEDCMGRVRDYDYDAIIGIGGIGAEARSHGLDGRLNWVGIGPTRMPRRAGERGGRVKFKHFVLLESAGGQLMHGFPLLARRMYEGRARYMKTFGEAETKEIKQLLAWAKRRSGPTGSYVSPDCLVSAQLDTCKPDCQPSPSTRSICKRPRRRC